MAKRFVLRNVAPAFADHGDELTLVVELLGNITVTVALVAMAYFAH